LTKKNEDYVAVDGAAADQNNKRAPSCPESSAGSPPVPDRALKPKINSSTHTPNSPISPPGTTGSNYSSTGNEDKFFPDYPVIAKNPSRNGFKIFPRQPVLKKTGSETGFLAQNLDRLLNRDFQGRISDRKAEQVFKTVTGF
jgi:hypothetical protein